MRSIEVIEPGLQSLVQDAGRVGWAHLGVPRSGWLDPAAARLANRLVGNLGDQAVVEALLGGVVLRTGEALTVAATGARAELSVSAERSSTARAAAWGQPLSLPAGAVLTMGTPPRGARCYLAVSGGFAVDPVLGSRSSCTLSGLGPPPLAAGQTLAVGSPRRWPEEVPATRALPDGAEPCLPMTPGPQLSWFATESWQVLVATRFTVADDSNRIGLRLSGAPVRRAATAGTSELPSQGLVLGAVQVPPDGMPVVFLADHPTTGGYPVIAVVHDVSRCAQLRPGDPVRFSAARPGGPAATR